MRCVFTRARITPPTPRAVFAMDIETLTAWASEANARTELHEQDPRWAQVAALTDADAAHMLQTVKRMARVLEARAQLGAALIEQRRSSDAALGAFRLLHGDMCVRIVRMAAVASLKGLAAFAAASSAFRIHAAGAAKEIDRSWAPQVRELRLLKSLTQAASPPPGLLYGLVQEHRALTAPPSRTSYTDGALIGSAPWRTRQGRRALDEFIIAVELWWDDRLVGASTGALGSKFPVDDEHCSITISPLFGSGFSDVPYCFAHDNHDDVDWEKLILRVYVCDRLSFRTRLVFQETLTEGFNFEGCCLATRDDRNYSFEYYLEASLDHYSVPRGNGPDAPLVGSLQLEFRCYVEKAGGSPDFSDEGISNEPMTNVDLATVLARVTEADQPVDLVLESDEDEM